MAWRGKDSRWYNTFQELEEANQRWEQTRLMKEQLQLRQNEAQKQEQFRREQIRLQREQNDEQQRFNRDQQRQQQRWQEEQSRMEAERIAAIRDQNRLLQEQSRLEYEKRWQEYEESKFLSREKEIEEDVFPLLKEAGIMNVEAFLSELKQLYYHPKLHHYEKFYLDEISEYFRWSLARTMIKLSAYESHLKNRNLILEAQNCLVLLTQIRDQLSVPVVQEQNYHDSPEEPKGVFAAFRRSRRSDRNHQREESSFAPDSVSGNEAEESLKTKANQIIYHFNEQLQKAIQDERAAYEQHDVQISIFEKRRLNSFSNSRELALERLSDISARYNGHEAQNYRLTHYPYPEAYQRYKKTTNNETGLFSGLIHSGEKRDSCAWEYSGKSVGESRYPYEEEDDFTIQISATGMEDLQLFDRAVAIVIRDGEIKTTKLMQELGIGETRAWRLTEKMAEMRIIGPRIAKGVRKCIVSR